MAFQPSRPVLVNTGLAVALVFAAVGAYETIGAPDEGSAEVATAPITLGTVSAIVSLTGNLDAPRTVGLAFAGTPGLVTDVWAQPGTKVRRGDRLAAVDPRPARVALAEARAAVARARASLTTAKVGQTRAEAHLDNVNVAAAIAALVTARTDLSQAYRAGRLDRFVQDAAVRAAERAARVAHRDQTDIRSVTSSRVVTHSRANERTVSPPNPGVSRKVVDLSQAAQARSAERNSRVTRSASAIAAAERDLTEARRIRAVTRLADAHEIQDRKNAATQAALQVSAVRAAAGVNAEGPRPGVVDTARAELAAAKAGLKAARYGLDNVVLRAPFDGVVVDVKGGIGETAAAAPPGSIATAAVPDGPGGAESRRPNTAAGFVTLADLGTRTVSVKVAESDVDRVQVGQTATVAFPGSGSGSGATLQGTVTSIAEQETVIGGVVQYPVRIALPAGTKERLGQTASVQILTGTKTDVLNVPIEAVITAGDQKVLAVLRDGRQVKIPVTVGLTGDSSVEVSSPLIKAGDLVVLPGVGR